jgi:hypothetical protein
MPTSAHSGRMAATHPTQCRRVVIYTTNASKQTRPPVNESRVAQGSIMKAVLHRAA